MARSQTITKPALSFWQIWNMCFGFLGIQFGFALQNANVSRIFQTLGASIEQIPLLWVAAPLTGLLVQPFIGYLSDRTWTRLGRRRPFFLVGAVFTSGALLFMPHSPSLWIAAGMLWLLDASINVTMEPFRAFVGDMLPSQQRPRGYLLQSFFIGIGAIVASALPWLLHSVLQVKTTAAPGVLPDTVRYSFYLGAAVLLLAVGWTIISTREYSPQELAAFEPAPGLASEPQHAGGSYFSPVVAGRWLAAGLLLIAAVAYLGWDKQLYLLAAGAIAWGLLQWFAAHQQRNHQQNGVFYAICASLATMPATMRALAWVQFFSWMALFAMWIYTTAAVTAYHFASDDPASEAYNRGADWVGVLFAAYNGCAALAAWVIPMMVRRFGLQRSHQINLLAGALALFSFLLIRDPHWLLLPMLGVGFAWASILAIPYALLADALPAEKMGLYMGIFNFFIVIPQLLAASLLGLFVKTLAGGQAIYVFILAGCLWLVAAAAVARVTSGTQPL